MYRPTKRIDTSQVMNRANWAKSFDQLVDEFGLDTAEAIRRAKDNMERLVSEAHERMEDELSAEGRMETRSH